VSKVKVAYRIEFSFFTGIKSTLLARPKKHIIDRKKRGVAAKNRRAGR
jgi:hypothetical protein